MQPLRKIASNLLWTPRGLLRHPLLEVTEQGDVRSVATCEAPDRMAGTEFYAGVLVAGFPDDYRSVFARMAAEAGNAGETGSAAESEEGGETGSAAEAGPGGRTLPEQLAELFAGGGNPGRALVVISGLDYATLRLTSRSRIQRIL